MRHLLGWLTVVTIFAAFPTLSSAQTASEKIRALIVDGQNNHNWKGTTPILKQQLEATGLFTVDVATAPSGKDTSGFNPKFADYQVIVSNYNGAAWPPETRENLEKYMKAGGGLVIVHAANNAFSDWLAYNEMIGLGGWGGRTEKNGPYIRYRDGKIVRDETPGRGGSHGRQHEFTVEHINTDHPITKGLPPKWLHVADELYDRLRGPAEKMTVLGVAFSDKATGGTGETEPILFTIDYGKGRIFHTTLGHSPEAMKCAGFAATYTRGTEWAATGKVTQPVPKEFPAPDKTLVLPAK